MSRKPSLEIGSPTNVQKGIGGHLMPGETDNLTDLEQLNEEILLLELNKRYENDIIYTYVGDILCAINPYKTIKGMYVFARSIYGPRALFPCLPAKTGPASA
jgi:hypothetical protein